MVMAISAPKAGERLAGVRAIMLRSPGPKPLGRIAPALRHELVDRRMATDGSTGSTET